MSTVAFGALTTRREKSDSGTSKSGQPPGLNSYIDILAALVPAEVLAIHALIIAAVTTTNSRGQTQLTQPGTLRLAFWLLIGLSMALFVLGRQPTPTPAVRRQQSGGTVPRWQRLEWQDLIRVLIPAAAFVGWTMLEPTSAWNAVAANMSSGTRLLIPLVGAVLLAAVTKALASHSDLKPSPAQMSELSALKQAAQSAIAEKAELAEERPTVQQAQQGAINATETADQKAAPPQATLPDAQQPAEGDQEVVPETTRAAPPPVSNGTDAEHEPSVLIGSGGQATGPRSAMRAGYQLPALLIWVVGLRGAVCCHLSSGQRFPPSPLVSN